MMSMTMPALTRVYQNHHTDSLHWDALTPRDDDIVIATPTKAGTTWTQTIVGYLLFPDDDSSSPILSRSSWVDQAFSSEDLVAKLEAQQHQRFMK